MFIFVLKEPMEDNFVLQRIITFRVCPTPTPLVALMAIGRINLTCVAVPARKLFSLISHLPQVSAAKFADKTTTDLLKR